MPDTYHLAEVNIALAREPLDSALLADFVAELDPVNARADRAAGFVWRMQTEDGDATAVRGFGDDPKLIINLTVWESLESLAAFAYEDPEHVAVMRRRREWFERLDLYLVLWWVPAGHRPTVAEAEARLDHLRRHGPTAEAFTVRHPFTAPDVPEASASAPRVDERWTCPS